MIHYKREDVEAGPRRPKFSRGLFDDGAFRVHSVQSQATKHDIKLFGPIEDATQFEEALEVLADAGENDLVVLHLSTPGGNCDAADTFMHYWHECRARKVVIASGGVHSAGSMILLGADEFQLSEGFNCLVHTASFGTYGKSNDVASHVAFEMKHIRALMERTYEGFMTPEEIEACLGGKDFWFDNEEFVRRVKLRAEVLGETLDTSTDE